MPTASRVHAVRHRPAPAPSHLGLLLEHVRDERLRVDAGQGRGRVRRERTRAYGTVARLQQRLHATAVGVRLHARALRLRRLICRHCIIDVIGPANRQRQKSTPIRMTAKRVDNRRTWLLNEHHWRTYSDDGADGAAPSEWTPIPRRPSSATGARRHACTLLCMHDVPARMPSCTCNMQKPKRLQGMHQA